MIIIATEMELAMLKGHSSHLKSTVQMPIIYFELPRTQDAKRTPQQVYERIADYQYQP